MKAITRFAPSPTGFLHLGHIFAASEARRLADAGGGAMRLRIEDIDSGRCRTHFHTAILEDLDFMGIAWDGAIMVQSERRAEYAKALESLKIRGLIYPCFLSRKEANALLSAPHHPITHSTDFSNVEKTNIQSPDHNPLPQHPHPHDSLTSPNVEKSNVKLRQKILHNTDRLIKTDEAQSRREQGITPAWRLRMEAVRPLIKNLTYATLGGTVPINPDAIGDEIIARKDIATSYHLSVVVDDAAQGISLITRGSDLAQSTPLHRILQVLLDLPEPKWQHHRLVLDSGGNRLASRHRPLTIRAMRRTGMDRQAIFSALKNAPKG